MEMPTDMLNTADALTASRTPSFSSGLELVGIQDQSREKLDLLIESIGDKDCGSQLLNSHPNIDV